MSNIKDVAKLAGVSVSTVSNILNDKTSVSEELHQKVIKAMEELDYHPNFLAINLRKKKISFIGVVVSGLAGHYHQIFEGINRVAKEHKCQPIIKIVSNASEEIREIESLLQLSVSGIIPGHRSSTRCGRSFPSVSLTRSCVRLFWVLRII